MIPKKKPKDACGTKIDGGTVTVGAGIRMSGVQFQSANFDISLTLPMKEGELPEAAIARVDNIVATAIAARAEDRMAGLYQQICKTMAQAQEQKRNFDR